MEYRTIIVRRNGPIGRITLNRPHRLNAVTSELYGELGNAIGGFDQDPVIRAMILTGEGRAFCVGADLKEHGSTVRTPDEQAAYAQGEQHICTLIQESRLPFIAGVNGYALGAGAEMALSCDFVIMLNTAQIGFPELSIGTYLGGGVTFILPRLVGLMKAKELIYLGRKVSGDEAQQLGLVYKSVPEEEFSSAVDRLATELSEKAPLPLSLAKAHLRSHLRLDPRSAMEHESAALLACMRSEDWAEGVRAFAEKRKPVFRGR